MKRSTLALLGVIALSSVSTHYVLGVESRQNTPTGDEALSEALKAQRAAKAATTDAAKFEALIRAGEMFFNAEKYDYAFTNYESASQIANLSNAQLSKVRWGLAHSAYYRDLPTLKDADGAKKLRDFFDVFLKTPGIAQTQIAKAHRLMAVTWYRQGDGVAAARELQKINPNYWDYNDAKDALHYLQESPAKKPSAATSALIDQLYSTMLNDVFADEKNKTYQRLQWGDLQVAYGSSLRAYAAWASLADDPKAAFYDRAQAIDKIAMQRDKDKQTALGLKAWDRAAKWPLPKSNEADWRLLRAQSRAALYQSLGNEPAVRTEYSTILTLKNLDALELWSAQYYIARSHLRESQTLQSSKPSIQNVSQSIQQHENTARSMFEKIVNAREAGSQNRFYAAMRLVDIAYAKKQYDVALKPVLQLTDEWTKSPDMFDDIYLLDLSKAAAQIYAAQNKFRDAVVALDAGLKVRKTTDAQANEMMRNYFYAALNKNDWNQGREILPYLRGFLPDATYDVESLLIEVNSESWPAAATALLNLESANHQYNDQAKELIGQAKARIPADALEKAHAAKTQN